MRHLILLAALVAIPAGLAAQPAQSDWRVAATDAQGTAGNTVGRSVGFVDVNSISRNGDRVSFTVEIHFLNQRDPNGSNVLLSHMQAECSAHRWSATDTVIYHDTTEIRRSGETPFEAVDPGTNGYAVITAACAGRFLTGTIADRAAYARTWFAAK